MDAQILPRHDLAFVTPQDKVFTQQPRLQDFAFRHVLGTRHDMPVIDENGVPVGFVGLCLHAHCVASFGPLSTKCRGVVYSAAIASFQRSVTVRSGASAL